MWLAVGAAVVAALWLAVQVVSVAMARRHAVEAPERALGWRPGDGPALARLAEDRYEQARGADDLHGVRHLARQALRRGPLEVRALRVLALVSQQLDQPDRAKALMAEAGQRSLRDAPSQLWLFQQAMARADYPAAFRHGDALMRRAPYRSSISPVLVLAAEHPLAVGALVERLSHRPPWRASITQELARTNPAAAFDVLSRLSRAGSTPSDAEVGHLVERMVGAGQVDQAYLVWVQLLAPEGLSRLADVYDGGFDGLPGATPFNWRLSKSPEASAEIAEAPQGGGKALYARFGAAGPVVLAEELLLLAPGRYRISTRAYTEEPDRGDQLRWAFGCAAAKFEPMAEIRSTDETLVWRDASAVVEVPAQGCAAQSLRLTGRPGDLPGFARAWFDHVTVERTP